MIPNIFRKDLKDISGEPYIASIAISCLSRICNEDLASILYKELIPLYTCQKVLIRRKVCILTHKIFFYCSDSVEDLKNYLADRLKDTKVGV